MTDFVLNITPYSPNFTKPILDITDFQKNYPTAKLRCIRPPKSHSETNKF